VTTALCCWCGASRPVSALWARRHGRGETPPDEPGDRCTVLLRCSGPCAAVTPHAWLRVDAHRDVAEAAR
jgi:hypothetical protein